MLDKQKTFDGLQSFSDFLQPHKYMGLLVTAEGTCATGVTADLNDIGQLIVKRNDKQYYTRSFAQYAKMNDIRGGKFTLDSTTGGAFDAATFIPFFEKGHPNILNVTSLKELEFVFNPGNTGNLEDLELVVYAVTNNALYERYEYRITGDDDSWTRALQAESFDISERNVSALYIDDLDDTIKTLAYDSNGKTTVSTVGLQALRGLTNINNRIEDATHDVIEIENHTPGIPGTLRNRNNAITLDTTGAGAYELTICSVIPGPNFMGRR